MGCSYCDNEQYKEAIESLLKAVELNPNNEYNWYELGRSYCNNKQYKESIELSLKAIELNPDSDDSWNLLGNSYCENKQYKNFNDVQLDNCFKYYGDKLKNKLFEK